MEPTQVVSEYFDAIRQGSPTKVISLFADDSTLANSAERLKGIEAISRMYTNGLRPGVMNPHPGPLVAHGNKVYVEIKLLSHGQTHQLCDVFTIDDGKIKDLSIYSLSQSDSELFDTIGVDPESVPTTVMSKSKKV